MFYAHGYDKGAKKNRLAYWQDISERTGKEFTWVKEKPECPDELTYVWDIYLKVKKGCDVIDWQSIANYQSATGDKLSPSESELLIDTDYLRRTNDGYS